MNPLLISWLVIGSLVICSGHPRSSHEDPNTEPILRLLKVFGLDQRVAVTKKHSLPPQYMVDLYRSVESGGTLGKSRSNANTVRSFVDKGSGSLFTFDVASSISSEEEIVEAEFHLFTSLSHERRLPISHFSMVQLYEGPANESGQLLESRLVSAHALAWEVFRIGPTVRRWEQQPNRGLSVKVLDSLGRDSFNRRIRHPSRKPILVVFSRDLRYSSSSKPPLITSVPKSLSSAVDVFNSTVDVDNSRTARAALGPTESGACSRRELRVDFERIGWSTWILSPKWYEAYVCAGSCAFPMGQNLRPTNHATVQSIVHELQMYSGIGAPCCVPNELRPVNLLYLDEHMNVVLKQYEDMVAAGCGCH